MSVKLIAPFYKKFLTTYKGPFFFFLSESKNLTFILYFKVACPHCFEEICAPHTENLQTHSQGLEAEPFLFSSTPRKEAIFSVSFQLLWF